MDPHDLTQAFTVWAAIVGLVGVSIVWELRRMQREIRAISEQFAEYMVETEHRITEVEAHLRFHSGYRTTADERTARNS